MVAPAFKELQSSGRDQTLLNSGLNEQGVETQNSMLASRREQAHWSGGKGFREDGTAGKAHQGLAIQRRVEGKARGTMERTQSSQAQLQTVTLGTGSF